MSKGIEKPSDSELLEDLQSIAEIKEKVDTIDLIRSKELIVFIKRRIYDIIKLLNDRLIACPHETFEYVAANNSQFGFNYNDLEYLKESIQKRINFLSEKQHTVSYNSENDFYPFKDLESKEFFEFLVKEWFNKLKTPISAISYVFYSMWIKSNLPTEYKDLKYKIEVFIIRDFAEYWNDNYSEKHKHHYKIRINDKSVRIKGINEITNKPYLTTLNRFIEVFEKLK